MLELRKRKDKCLLMWDELQLCHPLTADELIQLRQQIDWALGVGGDHDPSAVADAQDCSNRNA